MFLSNICINITEFKLFTVENTGVLILFFKNVKRISPSPTEM